MDFVLVERGDAVDEDPRQRAAEIDELVHRERHDARREDVVLHEGVPGRPEALEYVELHVVGGYLLVLGPVRLWRGVEGGIPAHCDW